MEQGKKTSVWESLQVAAIFVSCALLLVRCNGWMNRALSDKGATTKEYASHRYEKDFQKQQKVHYVNAVMSRHLKSR